MKLPVPIVALEVNDKCYGSCVHCTYEKHRYHQLLTESQLKKTIDAVCDIGCQVVSFTGREPLHESQRESTIKLVDYTRQRGAKTIGLNTEAKALASCIEQLADSSFYVDSLDVSVDGYGSLHDAIRGHKEWKTVKKLLSKENGPLFEKITSNICVSTVLQKQNYTQLSPLLEWLRDKTCVDHMMIAAVSMTRKNNQFPALPYGAFQETLEKLKNWKSKNLKPEIALEIPPDSVPEICSMVKNNIIAPEKVAMNDAGIAVVHVDGLPIRIMSGLYGVSVLRIRADGLAYIGYANLLQLPVCNVLEEDFYKFLDKMIGQGQLYSILEKKVDELSKKKNICPAWPFHLEECPSRQR